MRYSQIINKIQNYLEIEQNSIKRNQLRDIASELRYESRYERMATEKYYLQIINHAMSLMSA